VELQQGHPLVRSRFIPPHHSPRPAVTDYVSCSSTPHSTTEGRLQQLGPPQSAFQIHFDNPVPLGPGFLALGWPWQLEGPPQTRGMPESPDPRELRILIWADAGATAVKCGRLTYLGPKIPGLHVSAYRTWKRIAGSCRRIVLNSSKALTSSIASPWQRPRISQPAGIVRLRRTLWIAAPVVCGLSGWACSYAAF